MSFHVEEPGTGWNAPETKPWLAEALEAASHAAFNQSMAMMGEGGSIPFMAMLGKKFPQAQFVVTGVLGPNSNAHGPNEFLHHPDGQARHRSGRARCWSRTRTGALSALAFARTTVSSRLLTATAGRPAAREAHHRGRQHVAIGGLHHVLGRAQRQARARDPR